MYRQYPETLNDDHTFYVDVYKESLTHTQERFTIYQRSYILDEDNIPEELKNRPFFNNEGHPYVLLTGFVVEDNLYAFSTKKFLKFTIDALNNQYRRDNNL